VGIAYLAGRQVFVDAQLPLFLVLLEVPAIVVGIILARKNDADLAWGKVAHETFLGKSIVLLVGGLLIGWISGPVALAPLEPLFFDLFKGVLALFLLEMGLIAAAQARTVLQNGVFLIGFWSACAVAAGHRRRIAVPEANPSLSLAASLGVTFPFNIYLGIPVYYSIAQWARTLGA
jgi:hypothetical protein